MKKNYTRKLHEMEYGNGSHTILAKGVYKGLEFAVLNIRGMHPCGYVNVAGTPIENKDYDVIRNIECHGGLTFSNDSLTDDFSTGWWIGWDYGHAYDYTHMSGSMDLVARYMMMLDPDGDDIGNIHSHGTKYTTDDVISECKNVIDQVLAA